MKIEKETKFDIGEEVIVLLPNDDGTQRMHKERLTIGEIRWEFDSWLPEQNEPFYGFNESSACAWENRIYKLPLKDKRQRLTKRVTDSQGNPCVIVNDYRPQSIQSISVYERLAELEDAIEAGTLVEPDI